MVVPFCRSDLAVARHLPAGRSRAGDRHLNFHDYRDNLKNIPSSKVPNEIKSDVQTYGKAYAPLRAVYEKYNSDGAKVRAALQTDLDVPRALEALSSSSMWQAAATRLLTYQQEKCAPNG